ncbi:D-alanyl-D-alanine carboxypeptidase family protein [Aestuariivirga litoralis]|uniref:D-alanyl-D-alanine carboxypeptidase family protein n=1 Tax=Aestuariivirga litoralis TaxID=2650924 RepID=UPI0018C81DED|nr:D-alanyl-D-alanine carboxypeptidase family protein [Aestuariivirga litoralis]
MGVSMAAEAEDVSGPILVFDPATGDVISQDRAGEPWYPASLTKLMTAFVIFKKLRNGSMTLEQKLTISELAHSQPASHTGIAAGKEVTVDWALQALLVYSANDMATVLAEGADGSVENFAREMNATAQAMGLDATHFSNPNGLYDPRHISSARDIGMIAASLINQFPEYAHYYSQPTVALGKRQLNNHNALIRTMPDAVGMKTGFICPSGYNLVGSVVRNGKQVVSVVLGAHSGARRDKASKALLDDAFNELGKPGHVPLASIPDLAYGSIVPADMTTTVCKQKQPVTPVNAHHLEGWGVSFGTYDTATKADMALRGRLISPSGIDAGGTPGIIALPSNGGFTAMLWALDQPRAQDLCGKYKAEQAPCDVMTDVMLLQMAAAAQPEIVPAADQVGEGEGADSADMKPPAPDKAAGKTKRVRKKLN